MNLLAAIPVLGAGIYLIGLGVAAVVSPGRTKRFLGGFASSAPVHFAELGVRLLVGAGLVHSAARMQFSSSFLAFGWVVIGTSVALLAVPWRLHHRFATWSVPMATKRLPLFAFGSVVGGAFLLYALLAPGGSGQ